ncbi:MAG: type II toxin-antitoxin system VapC family toxin [Proteobacteria bacterium]|nr:type II toxin-antitoxin system VapC family toxin [Pseudomonadota bacterium]
MKKILIDTTIYSLAMKGSEDVLDILRTVDQIGISAISIGELYSGFKGGKRQRENKKELNIFLDSPRVLVHHIDVETAEYYASVLNQLKRNGTPIPTIDICIAASAFQHGYRLFTNDKHFDYVQGLILVDLFSMG